LQNLLLSPLGGSLRVGVEVRRIAEAAVEIKSDLSVKCSMQFSKK